MSQGRGCASLLMVMATLIPLMCLLFLVEPSNAATYTVGGPRGWSFSTNSWGSGKTFKAGDVLVFNYDSITHNVVAVDKNGYNSCKASRGARVFSSGKDQIKISRGANYFICNFPGHCESGMKIAINAA